MSHAQVRDAFSEQATWCAKLGSPFTARLCDTLSERLSEETRPERHILNWPGNPSPQAHGLPLRVCGALHSLARAKTLPALNAVYPPAPLPDAPLLWRAVSAAFALEPPEFERYLGATPQTNEVGRSAVLMCGFLALAARTGLPLKLYEIGASAGLNLIPDRYRYRFGAATWGPQDAQPLLAPEWAGPTPAVATPLQIVGRRGCDIAPLDLSRDEDRERLASYVWADQRDRQELLGAALDAAVRDPPRVERMEAASWVESVLSTVGDTAPAARVLYHSIVWHYLSPDAQRRIGEHLHRCGAAATRARPLAWLRFELDAAEPPASLRLKVWPDGDDLLLARAQPHGRSLHYLITPS
jgi:hypothetical protein